MAIHFPSMKLLLIVMVKKKLLALTLTDMKGLTAMLFVFVLLL